MKPNNPDSNRPAFSDGSRGFALVMVLAILALLTALVVGLLTRASTERSAASSYQSSITTRQLADTAVSLVQGQINLATNQGTEVAWTSQPGMVRTFNTSGNLLHAYKLYSAPNMISDSVGITGGKSSDEAPTQWYQSQAEWTDLNEPLNGIYPILDPDANASGYANTSGTSAMPVKWLYVLQNGSIVAPTSVSGSIATIDESQSPIVGRIAFWTDDESCKVNINTASEGTYWDTPRADTPTERNYARYQPVSKEFQRYPGHPATTSLSAVFQKPAGFTDQQWADQIYTLVPRVEGGGSQGGTAAVDTITGAIPLDSNRLYASVDELIFTPTRSLNSEFTTKNVEQAKFFLTAHSRAPETNLFNLPRIACWPIYNGLAANRVTAFDRLIAYCASTGTTGALLPYYFQRQDADSTTTDIGLDRNNKLYSYLQYLTSKPIPGFGGNFLTKYPNDRDQILTEIFDYIRCVNLYDDSLPKSPTAEANKQGYQYTNYRDSRSANPGDGLMWSPGYGFVTPTHGPNNTMGFGRFATLSEIGTLFICNAQANDPTTTGDESLESNDPTTNNTLATNTKLLPGQKRIQAMTLLEIFDVMQGYNDMVPDLTVKIENLDKLSVTTALSGTQSLGLPVSASAHYAKTLGKMTGVADYGGNLGFRYTTQPGTDPLSQLSPFIGKSITIDAPVTGGTMTFNGTTVTVSIYTGDTTSDSALVQKLKVQIPGGTFPIPNLVDTVPAGGSAKEFWWKLDPSGIRPGVNGRLKNVRGNPGIDSTVALKNYDVLRTVMVAHGDYRLVAATQDLTDLNVFAKHPGYDDTTRRLASSFGNNINPSIEQAWDPTGKYIASLSYTAQFAPKIPSDAIQTPETTGDYDTGMADTPDGAYINKPDDGNVQGVNTTGTVPYFTNGNQVTAGAAYFTPNREMPSPGMFGSLPTGVKANRPWQTLLFRPQSGHPGAESPKDHLFLDLFWMPVVEPYAISDRFSTAGKINLNYQILPFTNLTRSTGIQALLKGEKLMAIDDNASTYKNANHAGEFRYSLNMAETLKQFETRFSSGDVFKSASEICDLYMVPQGTALSDIGAFWGSHRRTGDNVREKIYTTLYPRLTVRSNTYTVHFRVQALKKRPTSERGKWTEGKDSVIGEYRGFTVIERFINPNIEIPDYGANPSSSQTLDQCYKWRVIRNAQFNP